MRAKKERVGVWLYRFGVLLTFAPLALVFFMAFLNAGSVGAEVEEKRGLEGFIGRYGIYYAA